MELGLSTKRIKTTNRLFLLETPSSHGVWFFMYTVPPRLVRYETLVGDLDAVSSLSRASMFLLLHAFDSFCMLDLLGSGSRPRGPWHRPALSEDKDSWLSRIICLQQQEALRLWLSEDARLSVRPTTAHYPRGSAGARNHDGERSRLSGRTPPSMLRMGTDYQGMV